MKRAVYVTSDLLFSSRVTQAARQLGLEIVVVGSEEAVRLESAAGDISLVILDLGRVGSDLLRFVTAIRAHAPEATIIAYGPHVDEAALASAHSAGCDLVLPRGQFDREMKPLLQKYLRPE